MEELVLVADSGRPLGSRNSRRLRREGKVPATVYGLDQDPQSLVVDWPDLRRVLTTDAGLNATIMLAVEGSSQLSIVKELQRHPVRRDVIHVDFLRVDPNVEVQVDVPITLIGDAREVTGNDGMVDQVLFALSIFAKPGAIPTELEVDISALTIGESVKVSDIDIPAGARTEVEADEAVAVGVVTRSTIEAMAADDAAEAAEAAEGEGGDAGEGDGAEGDTADGDADD